MFFCAQNQANISNGKEYYMETINGIYTSADIFTIRNKDHAIDAYAIAQLQMLCDNEVSKDAAYE